DHCRQALDAESDPRARAEIAVLMRTALVLADRPLEAIRVLEAALNDVGDLDLELVAMLEMAIATASGPLIGTVDMSMELAAVLRGRVARGETKNPWVIGACAISLAVTGERDAEYVGEF